MRRYSYLLVPLLLLGCRHPTKAPLDCEFTPSKEDDGRLLELADGFARDPTFRRTCLERSLINPENGYSKLRLTHYQEDDWGKLPNLSFPSRPVRPDDLGRPPPTPDESWVSVPTGSFPRSRAGLEQRGEQMFARFPAQLERSLIPILRAPNGPERCGLWSTKDSVGGLVWVALPGGVYPALSCSSCHAAVDESGALRYGTPNHHIDLGKAKDDYTTRRTLYSTWGPGRVDIAADGRDNPVVIADLRKVRFENHLHRTANVRNSLVFLGLRVETGLITAHRNALRPTPEDSFALATFLWSLGEPLGARDHEGHPDRKVFEEHCGGCHRGTAHTGPPVPAEHISSPTAALPSPARGTGKVQVTSLLGVKARNRLLFGGEARGLDELLAPERNVGGHYVGRGLSDEERRRIVNYLDSL